MTSPPRYPMRRIESLYVKNGGALYEYTLQHRIGEGKFGKVSLATAGEGSFAIKKICKKSVDERVIEGEADISSQLIHAGIIRFLERMDSDNHSYLISEYFDGSTLYEWMEKREFKPVDEALTKKILRQIIEPLLYCHQSGFAHRDIKLENIMINSEHVVKVIDFGLGTKMDPDILCKDYVGSMDYMAPEILKKVPYCGFRADSWSLGTVMYSLLFGESPFNRGRRLLAITKGQPHPPLIWGWDIDVSDDAKELMEKMICVNPSDRIMLAEIAAHPWFST